MKTKTKKGKAIIGIALVAIMLASVMAAMVMPAVAFIRDARAVVPVGPGGDGRWNTADDPAVPTVVIGELITLPAGVTQIQYATWDGTSAIYVGTGQILSVTALGVDTTAATTAGKYIDSANNILSLTDRKFDITLQRGGTQITSVVASQTFAVVVDTNIPGSGFILPPGTPAAGGANDIKVKIVDKKTGTVTSAGVGLAVTSAVGDRFVDADGSGNINPGDTWPVVAQAVLAAAVMSATGDVFTDVDASGTVTALDTWAAVAGTVPAAGQVVAPSCYMLIDVAPLGVASIGDIVAAPATAYTPASAVIYALRDTGVAGITAGDVVVASGTAAWTVMTGTGGLQAGEYTLTAETTTTGAALASIDTKSTAIDMTVRAAAIDVSASVTSQTTGNFITITTTAGIGVRVVVDITAGPATFDENKGDYPALALAGSGPAGASTTFIATIPADGTLEAVITAPRTGGVTIRGGIDANGNGVIDAGEVTDTISVSFRKAVTTVDVTPRKITIGEKVTMNGMTTSGVDEVAIFVDDVYQQRVAVEADDTYNWEWDTSLGVIEGPTYLGRALKPGAVTIKVFEIHTDTDLLGADGLPNTADDPRIGDGLHRDCGGDGPVAAGLPECSFFDPAAPANRRPVDASSGLSAVAGELSASMDIPRVAKEDDIVATGMAAGETNVREILIDSDGDVRVDRLESVMEDYTFETTIPTLTSWKSGTYKLVLITDGRDDTTLLTDGGAIDTPRAIPRATGIASATGWLDAPGATLNGDAVAGMTQEQIIARLGNLVLPEEGAAGSDDKMRVLSFKLEDPSVDMTMVENSTIGVEQISVDVYVTDGYLTIGGITNRINGTSILITAESAVDPKYDLPPETVTATRGTFTANLDASDAVVGKYTVTVDDLSRATDELDVMLSIVAAVPTPTPGAVPTPTPEVVETPTVPAVATPTPEPTPTPTPTPTPGFEAVFAIAGLLAVAYLVQRKRR